MCAKTTFVLILALVAAAVFAQQSGRVESGVAPVSAQASPQLVMVAPLSVRKQNLDGRIGVWKPGLVLVARDRPTR